MDYIDICIISYTLGLYLDWVNSQLLNTSRDTVYKLTMDKVKINKNTQGIGTPEQS